jgi:hypothetical protein
VPGKGTMLQIGWCICTLDGLTTPRVLPLPIAAAASIWIVRHKFPEVTRRPAINDRINDKNNYNNQQGGHTQAQTTAR